MDANCEECLNTNTETCFSCDSDHVVEVEDYAVGTCRDSKKII